MELFHSKKCYIVPLRHPRHRPSDCLPPFDNIVLTLHTAQMSKFRVRLFPIVELVV